MNVFFHFGFHKTGTTFTYQTIAKSLKALGELREGYVQYQNVSYILPAHSIVSKFKMHIKNYLKDPSEDRLASTVKSFSTWVNSVDKSTHNIIYCDENFMGILGSKAGVLYPETENLAKLIKELKKDFNIKVMLSFRIQASFIESSYKTILRNKPNLDFYEYLDQIKLDKLDWWKVISPIKDSCADENFMALPFELLLEDKKQFLNQVFQFFEIDIEIKEATVQNTALNTRAISMYRKLFPELDNIERRKLYRFLGKYIKGARYDLISPDSRNQITKKYYRSNKNVFKEFVPDEFNYIFEKYYSQMK